MLVKFWPDASDIIIPSGHFLHFVALARFGDLARNFYRKYSNLESGMKVSQVSLHHQNYWVERRHKSRRHESLLETKETSSSPARGSVPLVPTYFKTCHILKGETDKNYIFGSKNVRTSIFWKCLSFCFLSVFIQFYSDFDSDGTYFWFSFDSVLSQIWLSSDSVATQFQLCFPHSNSAIFQTYYFHPLLAQF